MNYGVLFERVSEPDFPDGYYYAHVPALGLTTHGLGLDGARAAARELVEGWLAEKRLNHESVPLPAECFFSTIEVSDHALQSA